MDGPAARVRIEMLGGFEVALDGRVVPASAWQRRPAEVVQLLALAPGRALPRDQVTGTLWPDLAADAGARNLHKAAHYARRTCGSDAAVVLGGGTVRLWPDTAVEIDLDGFTRAARLALRSGEAAACAAAADRYAGELLPADPYADWAIEARRHAHATWLQLLRAAGRWRQLAEADPADERAHRELMRLDLASGENTAAVRRFRQLCTALAHLDLCPAPATLAVYHDAVHGPGRAARSRRAGVSS